MPLDTGGIATTIGAGNVRQRVSEDVEVAKHSGNDDFP